jgi:hypothetical protein
MFTYTMSTLIHAYQISCLFYTLPCTFTPNNTSAFNHIHLHQGCPHSRLPHVMSILHFTLYFMLNNTSAFYHVHLHHVYPDSHLPCIMSTLYLILYFNTYQHVCLLSRLPTPYPHSRPHIMFHTINPCFWSNPLCI